MITEKEFIDKVKGQRGWVDTVDAFLLVHFFTQRFGIIYTDLSIEDELIYMWEKMNSDEVGYVIPTHKTCARCKTERSINDFYKSRGNKDGKENTCKVCRREYMRKWMNNHNKNKINGDELERCED